MPAYLFKCPECGNKNETMRPMVDSGLPEICDCGEQMDRDYQAEHSSVRGDYNEPIISDSMAFDAADLAEHRRQFPSIEVHVDYDRSARPVFHSLTEKRAYMKKRGWVDRNSFV